MLPEFPITLCWKGDGSQTYLHMLRREEGMGVVRMEDVGVCAKVDKDDAGMEIGMEGNI
jgi:hypothetical protein